MGSSGREWGHRRWVAYDAGQVFIRAMPDRPPAKWQVSENGGNNARWSADGRELFFSGGGAMMSAEIDPNESGRARALHRLFDLNQGFGAVLGQYAPGWDVTPDGLRFLTTLPAPECAFIDDHGSDELAVDVEVGGRVRLTPADLLSLFCTCTRAFCRFSPIEPIEFSKSFENSTIVADRLPPPPPSLSC
jgi:hypothetical protein